MGATDAAGYTEQEQRNGCTGGWWIEKQGQGKWDAHWFSVEVDRTNKWAYKENSSQRRIAALELLGTIILVKLIAWNKSSAPTHLTTPIATDNKGNAYNIAKDKAKQAQLVGLMMELAITCHMAQTHVGAFHVKRANNTWADALAEGNFDGFDPRKRHHFNIQDEKNWWIWNDINMMNEDMPPQVLHT